MKDNKQKGTELGQVRDQQYRTLIENLPQKIFFKDKNSVYISCNENYAKDLRIKPEEIVGKTDYDFFPTNLAEKYRADDLRIMESGKSENIEEEYMVIKDFLKDTEKKIINTVKVPVLDKAGDVMGLIGIFWDITERKKIEDALRVSEKKIRALYDQTFQFIGLLTPDGALIEANRTALEFSGIELSDVLNKPFWKTPWWKHSPELQEKLRQEIKKVSRGGEFCRFEVTHMDRDGALHYVDFSLKPVKDENGKVMFLIPEGRDITEYKEAEVALRESELKFRTIVEGSSDGIIFCETETRRITFANAAMARLLGYPVEEIITKSVEDLHRKADWVLVEKEFHRHVRGVASVSIDIPVVRKNGEIFLADISSSNFSIKGKSYFVAFFRDVTGRKK